MKHEYFTHTTELGTASRSPIANNDPCDLNHISVKQRHEYQMTLLVLNYDMRWRYWNDSAPPWLTTNTSSIFIH